MSMLNILPMNDYFPSIKFVMIFCTVSSLSAAWNVSQFWVLLVRIFMHSDWIRTRKAPNTGNSYIELIWYENFHILQCWIKPKLQVLLRWKHWSTYNQFHNNLRLFDVLPNYKHGIYELPHELPNDSKT